MRDDMTRWLRRFGGAAVAGDRTHLVCLPHAGGNAAFYRPWTRLLPPWVAPIAVQYPGRMDRIAEPPPTDMDALAADIAAAIDDDAVPAPFALFGHSLGASVAYEVAVRLTAAGRPPVHLFVSGRPAPHRGRTGALARRHLATDERLWREVVTLGGTDPELADNPQVRDLAVPVLRADYRLAETYHRTAPVVLDCPVTALFGRDDADTRPHEIGAWAHVAAGRFELHDFPGGHFYFVSDPRPMLDVLVRALRTVTDCDPRPVGTPTAAGQHRPTDRHGASI